MTTTELFNRCVFISRLLEKEEVQEHRITEKSRGFFDNLVRLMIERKILLVTPTNGNLVLKVGAETFILFVSSLIWPMIDSYYVTLLYTISMAIGKEQSSASVEAAHIVKRI